MKIIQFSKDGMEHLLPTNLEPGTMLCGFGYAMQNEGDMAVIKVHPEDDGHPYYDCVRLSETNPGFKRVTYPRPLSKKFGIGNYYYDDLRKADPAEIERFIALAHEAVKAAAVKAGADAKADADEIKALPGLYPHLKPLVKGDAKKQTMNNLRAELKQAFPGVKFSVTNPHYSTANISWEDGPSQKHVDAVVDKFNDSENDITGDFRDYSPSNFNRVFGGMKYVFTARKMSDQAKAIFHVWAEENFERWGYRHYNSEGLAHQLYAAYDVYMPVEIREKETEGGLNVPETFWEVVSMRVAPEKPVTATKDTDGEYVTLYDFGDMKAIQYTDKAVAVIGDTKPNKDLLKELGGRFNFRLACGPGWVFKAEDWAEIQAVLESV